MAALQKAITLYKSLTTEWDKKPPSLGKCGELLVKLKISLTELIFLPTKDTNPSKQELLLARDVLEIGVQYSVAVKDIDAFARYMAQLKCYYFDYKNSIPKSSFQYQLLGLNLVRLLAQNKLAEFHTEIELLPHKELNNIYIRHPISIEQNLIEGCYNKNSRKLLMSPLFDHLFHSRKQIFLARGNVPADSYHYFINLLLHTIRDEIAECIEKSYITLKPIDAMKMLFFKTEKEMAAYSTKRKWKVENSVYILHSEMDNVQESIPAVDLIEKSLTYAKELEMIV